MYKLCNITDYYVMILKNVSSFILFQYYWKLSTCVTSFYLSLCHIIQFRDTWKLIVLMNSHKEQNIIFVYNIWTPSLIPELLQAALSWSIKCNNRKKKECASIQRNLLERIKKVFQTNQQGIWIISYKRSLFWRRIIYLRYDKI